MRFEVEDNISRKQNQDQNHDVEIAPLASGDDFASSSSRDKQQEACIDKHRGSHPVSTENVYADTACSPENDEAKQRLALNGQAPGPVRNRSEQKPVITAGR